MMKEWRANGTQSRQAKYARINPEYRKVESKIMRLRSPLKQTVGPAREGLITQLTEWERQRSKLPYYAKDKKHPSKVGYARYADDFVILVQGKKPEAQAIRDEVGKRLQAMGFALSEEKTKLTHWRHTVNFLGYHLHGKPGGRGTSSRPILCIPHEKLQRLKDAIRVVCGYHHIPEIDAMTQISAM
ncbi:MAG TPA: reverse transcriptase domain-containing protein, partial [Rubrobacter sp.]|nr:reverse transcriptase domain-containing protein [Rubrobacter sp.]